ncbi:MAG: FliI/YscN family ATPase [Desulfovibrio sp.]|jgi:flagellum-specific ATP synthase|nr:FliI/YscN family ATPase [Desulfovibrio sp.]
MSLSPVSAARALSALNPITAYGKVTGIVGLVAEGRGIKAPLGSLCHILPERSGLGTEKEKGEGADAVPVEVVGFKNEATLFMPFGDLRGVEPGSLVRNSSRPPLMPVGPEMLGKAFDAFGVPLDSAVNVSLPELVPLYADPPSPLSRPRIDSPLDVGVRSVNALLTLGKGQRIGIMAGSGVGKSTLMGMMARYARADVNVIGLVGERGREVREFMEKDLGPEGMARSTLVVATSDQSPLVRLRAAYAATAVAEYFRDRGLDVLFMMDSVTRFAMALREIGLAVGEPPTTKGYTPSVFTQLPRLLERSGQGPRGAITGIYTVLVDGDDFNEPVADTTRSILDGHIVLTRDLADEGHFPAIDVLRSISRLRSDIVTPGAVENGRIVISRLAAYKRVEDMINIGAYAPGSNPEIDKAISAYGPTRDFLRQDVAQSCSLEESFKLLGALAAL